MPGDWWRRVKVQLSYELEVQRLIARQLEQLVQARPGPCAILDVGCGTTSMLAVFQQSPLRARCRLTGLDAHEPTITWCRAQGFHDAYLQADVRDPALPQSDIIVATDLVEHLERLLVLGAGATRLRVPGARRAQAVAGTARVATPAEAADHARPRRGQPPDAPVAGAVVPPARAQADRRARAVAIHTTAAVTVSAAAVAA